MYFFVYLFLEIWAFSVAIETFGFWLAVYSVILSAAIGFSILKNYGMQNLAANPSQVTHKMLISLGGVLLIVPGFLSDIIGILLILPGSRHFLMRVLGKYILSNLTILSSKTGRGAKNWSFTYQSHGHQSPPQPPPPPTSSKNFEKLSGRIIDVTPVDPNLDHPQRLLPNSSSPSKSDDRNEL